MNLPIAIDISTFIWCQDDFNLNKNEYFNLVKIAPILYDKIKELRVPLLYRVELHDLINGEFPYKMVGEISRTYFDVTLSFLTSVNWLPYVENNDVTITSNPNIKKSFYSDIVKIETQYQINFLFHQGLNSSYMFISYDYFYNHTDNLRLTKDNFNVDIDTLIYEKEADILQFYDAKRLIFKHNDKHKRGITHIDGKKVSPFKCFHQPEGADKAQKLLEKAIEFKGNLYNYDSDNAVYVRFLTTHIDKNVYHGHDLSFEKVPEYIKNKINKDGEIF